MPREADPRELAALLRDMRPHLRLSLAIIVGCLALAALLSWTLPRRYTAEAVLSYHPQTPPSKGGGELAMTDAQRDSEIDAQLAAVSSLPVAEDVARSVDLAADPALQQEVEQMQALGDRRLSRDEALGAVLLDHVKAQRVGQTPAFTIGVTARSAAQAVRIANGFAASYLKAAVLQKAALADASARPRITRIAELRRQTTEAEADLARFRLAHNLLDEPGSIALEQTVASLRGQLAEARGQASLAQARSAAADATTVVGGGYGGSVDTTPVSALTQQRAAAAAELAALLGRYGEKHPEVIAVREKLAESEAQLAQAMQGNRASAMVEARGAAARARAVAGSLQEAEARLTGTLSHDARLADLQNSAAATRQAYQDALKLSADQMADRALLQPDAQLIAPAVPPLRPKFPRLGFNLLIGLAVGLAASVGIAFLREAWRHRLGSVDDIARWLDADFFAPLPVLPAHWRKDGAGDPGEAVLRQPRLAFADGVRSVAMTALAAARQCNTPGGRVIGVCSALPGEGKTTASIAMGRVLAASGMTVALMASDVAGGSAVRKLAAEARRDELQRIDCGDFALIIAGLREDYEVVIIDTAPILPGGDQGAALAGMDALVLLARWRSTPVNAIREAMRRIAAAGGAVTGVALSMVA